MGDQIGSATKLYQLKAKSLPTKDNDWETTAIAVSSVCLLFMVIGACVINDRKKKAVAQTREEENSNAGALTVNNE